MCTELILALLYFLTIFIVNYFLYKLLQNYTLNICFLLKFKNIFLKFPKKDVKTISIFYFYSKNNFFNPTILNTFNQFSISKDLLVIGKTYEYFLNTLDNKKNKNKSFISYLSLLTNQYLTKKWKIEWAAWDSNPELSG